MPTIYAVTCRGWSGLTMPARGIVSREITYTFATRTRALEWISANSSSYAQVTEPRAVQVSDNDVTTLKTFMTERARERIQDDYAI